MKSFRRLSSQLLMCAATAAIFCLLSGCGGSSSSIGTGGGGGGNGGGGGGTGGGGDATTLTPGGAANIFVGSDAGASGTTTLPSASILQFAATSNGSVSPSASLPTPTGFFATTLTFDIAGQLYVGGFIGGAQTPEVLIFSAGFTSSSTPVRTIIGSPATFYFPSALAVDSAGLLYVLSGTGNPTFLVYSATADGSAAPLRLVTGPLTLIEQEPSGLAVDKSGTTYIANFGPGSAPGTILAFAAGANGNVAPTRRIAGANTLLSSIFDMDLDAAGNIYVLNEPGGAPITDTILEFASTATGDVAPMRTIAGANTGLGAARNLRVDAVGNIYVLGINPASFLGIPYIAAFASTASGNVAPAISFTSSAWPPSANYDLAVR